MRTHLCSEQNQLVRPSVARVERYNQLTSSCDLRRNSNGTFTTVVTHSRRRASTRTHLHPRAGANVVNTPQRKQLVDDE